MTEAEIIARARERLDEDLGASSQRYTTTDLSQYVYDCARWFIARSGCQYATQSYTQAANQLFEDLPCDCIQVERVVWNETGTVTPLDAVHTRNLDAGEGWWQRREDTRSRGYFLLGLDRIAFWPESTDGGEAYLVHYQQDVYDSVSAVPVEFHEALVAGVIGRCLLAEQKVEEGVAAYGMFRGAIAQYAKRRSSVDRQWSIGGAW